MTGLHSLPSPPPPPQVLGMWLKPTLFAAGVVVAGLGVAALTGVITVALPPLAVVKGKVIGECLGSVRL